MPEANTYGRTLAEVRRNLEEALTFVLEANRPLAAKDVAPGAEPEPITVRI